MGRVVGIDLGTTNSVVAVMEGGKPTVIANAEGMRTTPSVVAFTKDGDRLVGQLARRQAELNPQNTFFGFKRFMGQRYVELKGQSKQVSYTIRRDEAGNIKLKCPRLNKDFAVEEVSAMVLQKLAEEASRYLGEPVTGAVITVPAYFNDAQRQATRDAGRIAGLEVLRILNEPTAAALAYGLEKTESSTVLVFDLGGGTFDVSVLDVGDGVFEVKSTSGNTQLGGNDFDRKIVDWLAEQFLQQEGIDLRKERQSLQRLTEAAEKAKIELSGTPVTEINLPFITATPEGPKHLETRLQRSQFEEMCGDLFSQLRSPVKRALADAGLRPTQIDEIVLVGGSTRIPAVRELVEELLDLRPSQNVNPEEVVAIGAAIQAGILSGEIKNVLLLDVTPLSFGLETIGGLMKKLIPRNTTIPVRRTDIFSTAENNQTAVEVHIVQGERDMAQANKSLGRLRLTGIPPAPKGIPQIQVAFDIDANGILQVSAVDRTTGREQVVTIQGAANLNESEVQRMVKEAEQFSKSDRAKRDKIERRNKAEALTYQAERQLREVALEYGLQFASGQRRHIEELVGDLRAALTENNERDTDDFRLELESAIADFNRQVRLLAESEDEGFFSTLKKTLLGDDDEEFYDYRRGSDFNNPYGGNNYGYGNYNPSPYSDYRPDFKAPRRDFDAEVWDEPRRQPNRDENRGNFKDNPPPRRQSPASRDNFDDDRSRRQPNRDDFNDNPPPRRQSSPTRDNFDDDRSRRQPNRDNFNDNPPPRRQSPANRDNFDDDRSRRQPNRDNFNDNPPPRRQSSPNRDNNPPPRRQSPANRDDFDGNPPRRQPNRDDRQRPADIWDDDDW